MTAVTTTGDDAGERLDVRLREARDRLRRLEEQAERAAERPGEEGGAGTATVSARGGHVLFVPAPGGYLLVDRDGPSPQPGETVAPLGDDAEYVVTKVASSPLPGDPRPCAFLQEA